MKSTNPFPGSYDERLEYDKNGNILNLRRNGDLDSDSSFMYAQEIDVLGYTYKPDSNLLLSVSDDTANPKGFNDGNTQNDDFEYDNNGNMTMDLNKNIISITYNHLNLPTKILFDNSNYIMYLYTASGQKMEKRIYENNDRTITDYINGFQYKTLPSGEGGLVFFPHAEGYVNVNESYKLTESSLYNYVFNYTDHLGNIRMSYTQTPTGALSILEENHYYPFGLKHTNYNSDKRLYVRESVSSKIKPVTPLFPLVYNYKYNGKEWQDELGLNVTAMDYRQYDNAIGRFNSMDVLAELFPDTSPFSFSFNSPNIFADPTGLCPECEKNVKNPTEGQQYNSTGGATYTFKDGKWIREGGELDEVVITPNKKDNPKTEGQEGKDPSTGVGQPDTLESMIPIWGSGRAAVDHFQNGNYWQGTFYTAMAISDVFLVKSIATGIAKGGLAAFGKNYSTWSSWRKFYGKEGFAESGQHLHHWLLRRNGQKSGTDLAWKLKNQMWNLMPMRSPAFHTAVHGKGINAFNTLERAYYGSPVWFQTGIISTIGHSLQLRGITTNQEGDGTE